MTTMRTHVVIFCLVNFTLAQRILGQENNGSLEISSLSRVRREAVDLVNETPVRIGSATGRMVAGVSRLASGLPQFRKDGRHYWPTEYSLTNQIGLQGINDLVGDVANYERVRALAIARAASCSQRRNCWWSQSVAAFTKVFGPISENQKLAQKIDCNKVFAGCQHYH